EHGRVDGVGVDVVRGDAVAPELVRDVADVLDERGLRGTVGGEPSAGSEGGFGGVVDQAAAGTLLDHDACSFAGCGDGAAVMHGELLLDLFVRHVDDRMVLRPNAGRVEQHVDAAEMQYR